MNIDRQKTERLIKSLEQECSQDNDHIDKLDKGMVMAFKNNNLPVAHAFIGRYNKASYFHIMFWFDEHSAIVSMAKKHTEPKSKLGELQVLAYRQFTAVQKLLYQKMCLKQDRDEQSHLKDSLKLLLAKRHLTVPQVNALAPAMAYQLAYGGFPIGQQSSKDIDEQIKADELCYPKFRQASWWSKMKFHAMLAHYPADIVGKVIKIEKANDNDYSKYHQAVSKILSKHFSFDDPNPSPLAQISFHSSRNDTATIAQSAVQGSLF